jgi:hypothetical protein
VVSLYLLYLQHKLPNLEPFEVPVSQTAAHINDEVVELQNSLRNYRLSNDGLCLLLERTQSEIGESRATITALEEKRAQEANLRLVAELR